jgi:hypothetical protein
MSMMASFRAEAEGELEGRKQAATNEAGVVARTNGCGTRFAARWEDVAD